MLNMGAAPRKRRSTTTLDMAASTIEPSTAALHWPMTSSMTKRIAEMGALNAAASPAAAPMGAKTRSLWRDMPNLRAIMEATPAPICNDGSSGPSEWPVPMAMEEMMNLPMTVLKEMYPL